MILYFYLLKWLFIHYYLYFLKIKNTFYGNSDLKKLIYITAIMQVLKAVLKVNTQKMIKTKQKNLLIIKINI